MSFAVSQYRTARVNTASPVTLVVHMYDGAVRFLREAMDAQDRNDVAARGAQLGKAHAVISELRATLDHERAPELCEQLAGLYDFVMDRIGHAASENDARLVAPAIDVLLTLRGAWAELAQRGTP